MITLSTTSFIPFSVRLKLLKLRGVNFKGRAFIGANVTFDGIHPEMITIGNGATITYGTCILTHFYSVKDNTYYLGNVNIGDNVFIGAGSIVNCDIPANEVWAGNPARFIKKRQ